MYRFIMLGITAAIAGCAGTEQSQIRIEQTRPPFSVVKPADEQIEYQRGAPDDTWSPVVFEDVEREQPLDASHQQSSIAQGGDQQEPQQPVESIELRMTEADRHYELARALTEGTSTERDLDAAQFHLNAAAGLDHPEAVRVLGWQTLRGDTGEADKELGLAMLERAALGSARAQKELGMIYAGLYDGFEPIDTDRGALLLEQAAAAGDAEAAFQYGRLLYSQGEFLQAVGPLSLATEQGHTKAGALLRQIDPTAVEAVSEPLDAEALYQKGIAILVEGGASPNIEKQALGYAALMLAKEQGHSLAAMEVSLLQGVSNQMDKTNPGWLEVYKRRVVDSKP